MSRPLRVAVLGTSPALERSLAEFSPLVHPRCFRSVRECDPAFRADVVLALPGYEQQAAGLGVPIVSCPDAFVVTDLEDRLRRAVAQPAGPLALLLGCSPAIAKVRGELATMARTPLPLLITGENGTGKDLAAQVAHQLSPRAAEAFVAVNCGAVPVALAETEFFGCVRGAFTGAETRTGFCHQARGGTLFLDEIGETPLEVQAKLLRVLENHEIRRVGTSRVETADFRLICATNRPLNGEVKAGRFREDLYYRINLLAVRMPPLRERPEDIPLLARHFLSEAGSSAHLTSAALDALARHPWPGNLRQLRNVVVRAAVLHPGRDLEPGHFDTED